MDEGEKRLALESFAEFERTQSIARNLIRAIEEGYVNPKGSKVVAGTLFLLYNAAGKYIMVEPWRTIAVVNSVDSKYISHGLSDDEVHRLGQTMKEWLMAA